MQTYAVIESDLVVNIAVWDGDSEWSPGGEVLPISDDQQVQVGSVRNADGSFTPPPDTNFPPVDV